jgi:hypothetical protein
MYSLGLLPLINKFTILVKTHRSLFGRMQDLLPRHILKSAYIGFESRFYFKNTYLVIKYFLSVSRVGGAHKSI